MRSTSLAKASASAVGAVVMQRNPERRRRADPGRPGTVNVRSVCALNSVGLSIR